VSALKGFVDEIATAVDPKICLKPLADDIEGVPCVAVGYDYCSGRDIQFYNFGLNFNIASVEYSNIFSWLSRKAL